MMNEIIAALPKVDLHCHLDGSLVFAFVKETLAQRGENYPDDRLLIMLQAADDCNSLAEYLERFELPIRCMQTSKCVAEAAYSFVRALQADSIKYCEVRFSPALLANPQMTERQALESVLQGLSDAKRDFGISSNAIICAMRHFTSKKNLAIYRLAHEYYGKGVCAVDLAGDEASMPNCDYAELFVEAQRLGMQYTIHAGECGSAESIRDAITLGASRIGHGIAMRGNHELQQLCAMRRVGVEMCPISNFQTKAVVNKADYPIREFLQNGVLVTVNTDNRTASNTSMTREFTLLADEFAFTIDELNQLTRNAILCSYADDDTKEMLLRQL